MLSSLFPVDSAERYLRGAGIDLERHGNCLRWPSFDGITELRVTDVQETFDGLLVSELVTLTHVSDGIAAFTPKLAALVNKWATISSIVGSDSEGPTRLVAKVGIFSSDREAAERVYAPLLCMEAAYVGWHAAQIARGEFELEPAASPLASTDQLPPFDTADFQAAKAWTDRYGYLGSLSDHHFTVEFPWEAGAISNLYAQSEVRGKLLQSGERTPDELDRMAGPTSLLQLLLLDHPLYGKGIQSRLEIPVTNETSSVVDLVDELNRWELSGVDLPPLFGSWCAGDRAPTFVSFIPTQHCIPGLLENLTVWAMTRHARLRQWMTTTSTSH